MFRCLSCYPSFRKSPARQLPYVSKPQIDTSTSTEDMLHLYCREFLDVTKSRDQFHKICNCSKPLFKGMSNPNPFLQYILSADEDADSCAHFKVLLRGSLSFIKDEVLKRGLVDVGAYVYQDNNRV